MILYKKPGDLMMWLGNQRDSGKSIGFVPTMGALHEGHISLIAISKKTAGLTVCSIFVNPTQFNDQKDFKKYPITLEKDMALLLAAGTDVLFLPDVEELYPQGLQGLETYELGRLETLLEGKFRPGHFQGVCQVMRRLLEWVRPDHLFMGQKDYQQCMVVQRLLAIRGIRTELHRCPILRESDGLAMSSRNLRLTTEQRAKAPAIYRALLSLKDSASGDGSKSRPAGPVGGVFEGPDRGVGAARKILEQAEFRVDYVEIADPETLEPLGPGSDGRAGVALIAAFQGEIRLIDNLLL